MCDAGFPVWAMVTFGTVVFALGFEAGRVWNWVHDLWRERKNG